MPLLTLDLLSQSDLECDLYNKYGQSPHHISKNTSSSSALSSYPQFSHCNLHYLMLSRIFSSRFPIPSKSLSILVPKLDRCVEEAHGGISKPSSAKSNSNQQYVIRQK